MDLYLIRHADAGDRRQWEGDDADRPLTELGRTQSRTLGAAFKARGITVDAILTSPLTRTVQTAGEFHEALGSGPTPTACELLEPEALRRRKLTKHVIGLGVSSVALVGHNPDLSAYLGWLLGVDPAQVELEKGGVAKVSFEDEPAKGEGVLGWLLTPAWYGV
ncbi:MAG TPA: histidine phosphatase family protein [Urbifossiella sp.]|jgi:phosphohistidine phosphatase|nr:histidine phosphatase family protein [Urbifossiella sp.]